MACKTLRTPAAYAAIERIHEAGIPMPHLKYELNRLYPDGRKVFAVNDQPLKFFDISIVVRPGGRQQFYSTKGGYDGYRYRLC